MDRWRNKTAVVTGASSGIGAACAIDLVKSGMKVVGLARRENRLHEIRNSLPKKLRENFHPIKCDVTKEDDVLKAFKWVEEHLGGVDVLINNAGISRRTELVRQGNTKVIKDVLDTNVLAVVFCVREAFQQMSKNKVDGHVIIVNSIAGHCIPRVPGRSLNIYPPSKYAVTAMAETYSQEFSNAGTNIKVTVSFFRKSIKNIVFLLQSVSPGATDTELISDASKFMKAFKDFILLKAEDVSNAILYCLSTPPNVQIQELTLRAISST